MKNQNKVKRINLNVPLYLLKEIDELARKNGETRTDIIIKGIEDEVGERRRRQKLNEFLTNKKNNPPVKFIKEVYDLGTNEWVRKLRQEWDIREEKIRKGKK